MSSVMYAPSIRRHILAYVRTYPALYPSPLCSSRNRIYAFIYHTVYLRVHPFCTCAFLPLASVGSPWRTREHENRIFFRPVVARVSISSSKSDNVQFFGSSYGSSSSRGGGGEGYNNTFSYYTSMT